MRIVDELLAELPAPIAPGRTAAIRAAALKSIAADLRRYLRHEAADEGAWEPRELELRFGFEGEEEQASLPALELGAGVRVRGIIDRVDVDSSGHAIVRDYKSGGMRPEYQGGRWRTDRRLQVALYMLAVGELLGLEPVAGLYQPLGGGDLRARGLYLKGAAVGSRLYANDGRGTDELQAELEDACSRAVELATRLRSGQLEPCPQTCSRQGCRYPGICRA
jgi:RecB family exonuclease